MFIHNLGFTYTSVEYKFTFFMENDCVQTLEVDFWNEWRNIKTYCV
jgi:hypothetical protein